MRLSTLHAKCCQETEKDEELIVDSEKTGNSDVQLCDHVAVVLLGQSEGSGGLLEKAGPADKCNIGSLTHCNKSYGINGFLNP